MLTTFSDSGVERRLRRNGIAVLRGLAVDDLPWLSAVSDDFAHYLVRDMEAQSSRADQGRPVAWQEDPAPGPRWRIGANEVPYDAREELERRMAPYWQSVLDRFFVDHRVVLTSLLDKRPGSDGALPLHQDPTILDEREARAVTIWIALDDIDVAVGNGSLEVLPGSHVEAERLRGPAIPPPYIEGLGILWKRTIPVGVRAGDAVVWDGRVVHGSGPNLSGHRRRAVVAQFAPNRTGLVHAAKVDGRIHVLAVEPDFYRRHSPRELATAPPGEGRLLDTADLPDREFGHYLRRSRWFGRHALALRRESRRSRQPEPT